MGEKASTRGRPRLAVPSSTPAANDEDAANKIQKRRARLRDAQQAHRARKDATIRLLSERVTQLEGVVGGMGAAMARLGGALVRDHRVLEDNPDLARQYALAARQTLLLARAASTVSDGEGGSSEPEPGDDSAHDDGLDGLNAHDGILTYPTGSEHSSGGNARLASVAAFSQRLGAAAFPISSPSVRETAAAVGPNFYVFSPATRDTLLYLAAGRDSLLARFFFFACRSIFDAFLVGDTSPMRMFFRFSPALDDPAAIAERLFATLQLILFGSYDSGMKPPFSAVCGPFVDEDTVAPGEALGQFAAKVVPSGDSALGQPRHYEYKPKIMGFLSNAVENDMYSSIPAAEYMDANDLVGYLASAWNIYEHGAGRVKILLRPSKLLPTMDQRIVPDFGVAPERGLNSMPMAALGFHGHDHVLPANRMMLADSYANDALREAIVDTEALFAGLYVASICAGTGMRLERRKVDQVAMKVIKRAFQLG